MSATVCDGFDSPCGMIDAVADACSDIGHNRARRRGVQRVSCEHRETGEVWHEFAVFDRNGRRFAVLRCPFCGGDARSERMRRLAEGQDC